MDFHPHPDETRRIGAPANWDPAVHGECGALSVADRITQGGQPFMESLWRPGAVDLSVIAAGGALVLGVCGPCPFVSLTICADGRRWRLESDGRVAPDEMGGDLTVGFGMAEDGRLYPFFQRPAPGEGGIRFHESIWPIGAEAAAALAEGGLIALAIGGKVHPVVYLGVAAAGRV